MTDKKPQDENLSSDDEFFEDAVTKEITITGMTVNEFLNKHAESLSLGERGSDQKSNPDEKTRIESELELKPDYNDKNEDEDDEKFKDCHDDLIDDEHQREQEKSLSVEQHEKNKENALLLKQQGNDLFANGDYEKSIEVYTSALRLCPVDQCASERSIIYGNRAAAKIKLDSKNSAIEDCNKSLEFNPNYIKVLLRRAKLFELTDKFDEAFEDYRKLNQLEPGNTEVGEALIRLPPVIAERNEKMKTEMLGKLKDLGNIMLKPFGLSTNNFQMQQDPSTGSYSINFNQNSASNPKE